MRKSILMAIAPIAALLAVACGSSSKTTTTHTNGSTSTTSAPSSSGAGKVTISTRTVKPLGVILTNGAGHTLYIFEPDKKKKVSCVGACAAVWPPVKVPSSGKAVAAGAVSASLLSSLPNPSGGRVVTYNGWPLYAYVSDTSPGVAHGQGLKLNGGLWYVMSPSGNVIKRKASSSSSSGPSY